MATFPPMRAPSVVPEARAGEVQRDEGPDGRDGHHGPDREAGDGLDTQE
jgi:hypothetical protein